MLVPVGGQQDPDRREQDTAPMTISAPEAIIPAYILTMAVLPLIALTGVVRLSFGRFLAASVFLTYAAMVAAVTIFPIRIDTGWRPREDLIERYVLLQPLTDIGHPQFILNIVMFVPFGLFLPMMLPPLATLPRVALAGLLASMAIEGLQLAMLIFFGNRRWVEIDDLIANTTGAAIGYVLFAALALAIGGAASAASHDVQRRQDPVLR